MKQSIKKKMEGFTIIEVMIVLAIAGLIMLIVFLAVPALQRNSRNTQRNNDASLVGAAINECLNNRNGQVSACNDTTKLAPYIDTTKLRQLTTTGVSTDAPGSSDFTTVNIALSSKCNSEGSARTNGTTRQIALLFNTENSSGGAVTRCQEV